MATASFSYNLDLDTYPDGFNYNSSLADVLYNWASEGVPGTHPTNTGGFYENGEAVRFNGDTYAFTTGSGYAFSATGELSYYFPPLSGPAVTGATSHTLYGTLESISFGGGLNSDGTVNDPFLTITFDDPIVSALLEGYGGDVHSIVYGLMSASVDELLTVLGTDYGVDVTNSLVTLGSASLTESDLALAA